MWSATHFMYSRCSSALDPWPAFVSKYNLQFRDGTRREMHITVTILEHTSTDTFPKRCIRSSWPFDPGCRHTVPGYKIDATLIRPWTEDCTMPFAYSRILFNATTVKPQRQHIRSQARPPPDCELRDANYRFTAYLQLARFFVKMN